MVVDVVLVGCGQPNMSMGWFHLTQLLADAAVVVVAVVEPFFMSEAGGAASGAAEFRALTMQHPALKFYATVAEVPTAPTGQPLLAIIAGRTIDAPARFSEVLELGVSHIYLEKPGAASAAALREMAATAASRAVPVLVGYNKNVSGYMRQAGDWLAARPAASPRIVLEHFNDFAPGEELRQFLRGPGSEGMLHNMLCHELALATSLFGVAVDRVRELTLDREASDLVDLGDGHTDWSRVAFCLELAPAPAARLVALRFAADRCGGNYSRVRLLAEGEPEVCFQLPALASQEEVARAVAASPEMRPYFVQQQDDYRELKSRFVAHIASAAPGLPPGAVSIDGAVEALRLADLLGPALKELWAGGRRSCTLAHG